jgi:hypothetical protein
MYYLKTSVLQIVQPWMVERSVNGELGRMWKKPLVLQTEILWCHLHVEDDSYQEGTVKIAGLFLVG